MNAALADRQLTPTKLAISWWHERENPGRREKPTRNEYAKVTARFRRFFDKDEPSRTVEVARWIAEQLDLPFYEYYPEDLEEAEALELVTKKRERRREAAARTPEAQLKAGLERALAAGVKRTPAAPTPSRSSRPGSRARSTP